MLQSRIIGDLIKVVNFLWAFWAGFGFGWLCFGSPDFLTFFLTMIGGYVLMGIVTLIIVYFVSGIEK